jgi:hypothetical protein
MYLAVKISPQAHYSASLLASHHPPNPYVYQTNSPEFDTSLAKWPSQLLTLLHRKACHDGANIVQLSHIYEIAEISPLQQFEGHMTMSAVMTL